MPTFDFECPKCKKLLEDEFVKHWNVRVKCPDCDSIMNKLPPTGVGAKVFPIEGVYLEHVSPEGKTFHSTGEMRKYERDNDVELGYLL